MNIVSYRGPGKSGDVSSGLGRLWSGLDRGSWWYLEENHISSAHPCKFPAKNMTELNPALVKGHYDYCNSFLWPILHDLPQYATYNIRDRYRYNTFNNILASTLTSNLHAEEEPLFVQDYQLALLPLWLSNYSGPSSGVFWHIPWPCEVDPAHVEPLEEIACGLLHAQFVGFHTAEYAENFMNFVSQYLPAICDRNRMAVRYSCSNHAHVRKHPPLETHIIVAPLGIDMKFWATPENRQLPPSVVETPFVLSVDRADYTKGVLERIRAIDSFFTRHPQHLGNLTFAQICNRTRPGIAQFDQYWAESRALANSLCEKWQTENWRPLNWIEEPMSQQQLATLYGQAEAMLVNPIRDGLNLTAKEFIACQNLDNPGVLLLSHGAGAWHELAGGVVTVNPLDANSMADSINRSLTMSPAARRGRITAMNHALQRNTLEDWWVKFAEDALCPLHTGSSTGIAAGSYLRI